MQTFTIGTDTYNLETFPLPAIVDTNPAPLALAVRNGVVALLCEFDHRYYTLPTTAVEGTAMTAVEVPSGGALFRNTLFGADAPTEISFSGEAIQITSDGTIWVAQGGNVPYSGAGSNYARIVARKPDGTWLAYTLPGNSAGVVGFYFDEPSGTLWVMCAGRGQNALLRTRTYAWLPSQTNPSMFPPVAAPWDVVQYFGGTSVYPALITKLFDGRMLGTWYTAPSTIFTIDADDRFTRYPAFTGGNGVWAISQSGTGIAWIVESPGNRMLRFDPTVGTFQVFPITGLDAGEFLHSAAQYGTDTLVTTYSSSSTGSARFVRVRAGGTIIESSAPLAVAAGGLTGVAVETPTVAWAALFRQRAVARITKQ